MKGAIRIRRCATLADVRREIDRLDKQIVRLLAERAGYVGEAARVKERASQIVDRARIEQVVGRAGERAEAFGADGETIARIYRAMIDAFIAFERRAFVGKGRTAAKTKGAKKKAAKKAKRPTR
ncbi:MAG: chorismate mutase [Gemmatimonas sp.]